MSSKYGLPKSVQLPPMTDWGALKAQWRRDELRKAQNKIIAESPKTNPWHPHRQGPWPLEFPFPKFPRWPTFPLPRPLPPLIPFPQTRPRPLDMSQEYSSFAEQTSEYRWPWEKARWHELVFCLLARIADSPEGSAIARETTHIFVDLDLLEIEPLAKLASNKDGLDYSALEPAVMLQILERQGYNADQAKAAVTTICEAAHAVQAQFDGHVQRYLRQYGNRMLDEIGQHFKFSNMKQEDVRYAFTHWLQNVLDMPLPLFSKNVNALCRKLDIEVADLVRVADHNDVNVALVDDWASDYVEPTTSTDLRGQRKGAKSKQTQIH